MGDQSDFLWRAAFSSGTPKRMIAAFRKRHGARVRVMHLLHLDWPEMRFTMQAVAGYLTDALTGGDRVPLLHHALLAALADYEGALTATRPDRERLRVFVGRLFGRIAELTDGLVLRDRDGGCWRAADGIPLIEWLAGRDAGGLRTVAQESAEPGHGAAVVLALHSLALPRNIQLVLSLSDDDA